MDNLSPFFGALVENVRGLVLKPKVKITMTVYPDMVNSVCRRQLTLDGMEDSFQGFERSIRSFKKGEHRIEEVPGIRNGDLTAVCTSPLMQGEFRRRWEEIYHAGV